MMNIVRFCNLELNRISTDFEKKRLVLEFAKIVNLAKSS